MPFFGIKSSNLETHERGTHMKHLTSFISILFILLFFCSSAVLASELVDLDSAKRAAEYHGELIFEKDLKICDQELMYWPWGEPAAYVFTLMGEGSFYPQNITLDNTLLQGAYLVSTGEEVEGYTMMAQADRYMTVIVGATSDMPSFMKAHAGLPEHILSLAVMENPPLEPYWIYGGLFHTYVSSEADKGLEESYATEIHLEQEVMIKDLGFEKKGIVPAYAEQLEWGIFINPDAFGMSEEDSYLINLAGVKEGKHQLTVKEYNIKGNWVGCSPAAFVNCLEYLEKRGKINTGGKGANYLLQLAAICYRTTPYKDGNGGGTTYAWIVKGSKIMFKGLGYNSSVKAVQRSNSKPGLFLTRFAKEINANFPCNLGSTGKGVFEGHSTTGIGYWKQGTHMRLIIHDGWKSTPNQPVYVKYSGYPDAEIEYPRYMRKFHPGSKKSFPDAEPEIKGPDEVQFDEKNKRWKCDHKFKSKNKVKIDCYAEELKFYNSKGKKYKTIFAKRHVPFWKNMTTTIPKPPYKSGELVYRFFFVDDNGHLLQTTYTVQLVEGTIVGTWRLSYKWKGFSTGQANWYIYDTGRFRDSQGGTGKWTLDDKKAVLSYQVGGRAVYRGTVNDAYTRMNGTMKDRNSNKGTWSATKKSNTAGIEKINSTAGKVKPSGPSKQDL